ncbi:protein RecA [Murinocardiopsis flavida]|uniref:Protein RecA n=1 Tax=Murinocardiopsis flavida TaxID=645275 RepID=A0A2P8DUV7_9ACTN|nr:protein RecA [Murinocardiopsis flavida]
MSPRPRSVTSEMKKKTPTQQGFPVAAADRDKALETALAQIERQFGKGSVMRLGDEDRPPIESIPTGAISLDAALGIGGIPRGRIVEIYGPESSGKCVVADTNIWTDYGLETVAEVFERANVDLDGDQDVVDIRPLGIRVVNENGDLERVDALTKNGLRMVNRIALRSGRSISTTLNHPLRVMSSGGHIVWRDAGELETGDYLVSARFGATEAASGGGISEDEAVFLGYLTAEGSLGFKGGICFTNGNPEVGAEFSAIVSSLFDSEVRVKDKKGGSDYLVYDTKLRKSIQEQFGLDYVKSAQKRVPRCVRTAGDKMQRAFLSALFEGDGWIDTSSSVGLGTASERLARDVQLLLYGLGIPASVYRKYNAEYERHYWSVIVNPSVAHRFLNEVGFRSQRRAAQVEANFRLSVRSSQFENIPHISGQIRDLRDAIGADRAFDDIAGDLLRSDVTLACSRDRLHRIIEWAENRQHAISRSAQSILGHLKGLAAEQFTYEEITDIEDAGLQPTFDIMVPETHSFIANGVLSHNTTVALHAVASAQAAGGIAAFVDAEHALDPVYAGKIGVNTDDLLLSQPDTGEQALEITDMLIRSGAVSIIVIDSVAALVPRAEIEGEMGDSHVGLQARLMSQALRKIAGALHTTGTTAVFINQLREKVGVMFGSPETTTGGKALKFYSSVRLDVRRIETLKDGTDAVANRTRVKVVKNKVAPPFKQAEFDIVYGVGISREGGLIDIGVEQGIVRKSGAWYTYEGTQLGQGKENARTFLRENVDLSNEIEKKIKEKMGVPMKGDDSAGSTAGSGTPMAKPTPTKKSAKGRAAAAAAAPAPDEPAPAPQAAAAPAPESAPEK